MLEYKLIYSSKICLITIVLLNGYLISKQFLNNQFLHLNTWTWLRIKVLDVEHTLSTHRKVIEKPLKVICTISWNKNHKTGIPIRIPSLNRRLFFTRHTLMGLQH